MHRIVRVFALVIASTAPLACGTDDGITSPAPSAPPASTTPAPTELPDAGPDGPTPPTPGPQGCARHATEVVAYEFGPGQEVGRVEFPHNVFGPPHGSGCCQGNADDVVSLGNGGTVTLGFGKTSITDGPGADFVVFENAFHIAGDPERLFAELATVEVSADGQRWTPFECTATEPPYGTCAGWHAVHANPDTNAIDPLDPNVSGGDAFDLADIGLPAARFVRITDRADLTGLAGVFDLDALSIVNARCD